MRRAVQVLVAVGVLAVVVIGLLQASDKTAEREPTKRFDAASEFRKLEGAPAPLAALHDQAAEVLGGGRKAFEARIAELEGHPIVINKWGSWCGPCRTEFPIFQRVATDLGKEVAFLGIDGADPPDRAREFLTDFPVPYPSYRDENGQELSRALGVGAVAYPTTIFIDEQGEVVTAKQGEYVDAAELRKDLRRYLGV